MKKDWEFLCKSLCMSILDTIWVCIIAERSLHLWDFNIDHGRKVLVAQFAAFTSASEVPSLIPLQQYRLSKRKCIDHGLIGFFLCSVFPPSFGKLGIFTKFTTMIENMLWCRTTLALLMFIVKPSRIEWRRSCIYKEKLLKILRSVLKEFQCTRG